jgi:hypothetical protein
VKTRAAWLAPTIGLALALGCAAQYEEPTGNQPDQPDMAREQVGAPDPAAMEPTAVEQQSERSLQDFQLELASNEARLRALGVQLPSRGITGGDADLGGEKAELAPTTTELPGGSAGTTSTPDARPSTAPKPEPVAPAKESKPAGSSREDRKDKPKKKAKNDDAVSERFAQPPPEQAKSTPLSPTDQPQLDAATRCIQVCELSEITCELGVQICELAQRHAGDQDYEQACARATEDCDAAQEACDVCAG